MAGHDLRTVRPKLRGDVFVVPSGDRTYLRGGGRTLVASRAFWDVYERTAPHLDGTRTVAELTDGLADAPRRAVTALVARLVDCGLARDTATAAPHTLTSADLAVYAAEIAFLEAHHDSPEHVFEVYRNSPLLVVGSGLTALAAVRDAFHTGLRDVRAGCADETRLRAVEAEARVRDPALHLRTGSVEDLLPGAAFVLGIDDVATAERAAEVERLSGGRGVVAGAVGEVAFVRRTPAIPPPTSTTADLLTGPAVGVLAAHAVFACLCAMTGVDARADDVLLDLRTLEAS